MCSLIVSHLNMPGLYKDFPGGPDDIESACSADLGLSPEQVSKAQHTVKVYSYCSLSIKKLKTLLK